MCGKRGFCARRSFFFSCARWQNAAAGPGLYASANVSLSDIDRDEDNDTKYDGKKVDMTNILDGTLTNAAAGKLKSRAPFPAKPPPGGAPQPSACNRRSERAAAAPTRGAAGGTSPRCFELDRGAQTRVVESNLQENEDGLDDAGPRRDMRRARDQRLPPGGNLTGRHSGRARGRLGREPILHPSSERNHSRRRRPSSSAFCRISPPAGNPWSEAAAS